MKYLFFDIECSNGHNICSFGYVIADQSFCILQKEDIVINPESPILLAPHGKRPKIQLAYSDDYLKQLEEQFVEAASSPRVRVLTRWM